MSKIKRVIRLSWLEKQLFVEAHYYIFLARLMLLFPMNWYSKYLVCSKVNKEGNPNDDLQILIIKDAVKRASRNSILGVSCLKQAIAAKWMLNKRKIHCTLHLGVAKTGEKNLIAHAWTKCSKMIITGEKGIDKYTEVSKFE